MKNFGIYSMFVVLFLKAACCKYIADEVNSVLYDLSISALPLSEGSKDELQEFLNTAPAAGASAISNDHVAVGNKHGQKYYCRFPAYVEQVPGSSEGLLDPPPSSKVTNEEIRDVLDPVLKGLCFKNAREIGWWTYELCYRDSIMQYHLENDNKRTGETIYLGRFESEKDWSTPEAIAELTGKRKKTLYHTHAYTNGTLCDLTNSFRRAEVRFMCSEEMTASVYLHSIDEPESCDYVLTVYTAALCRLPAFLPAKQKPTPLKIQCQPVLSAPEYDKYLKAKEADEARKEEEAARKKQEQELKLKTEAEKKKYQKPKSQEPPTTESASEPDLEKAPPTAKDEPVLDILGRLKADFLKSTSKKESNTENAASASGSMDQNAKIKESQENRVIGAEGTIEYEYMTHWLEQELKNLAMDDKVVEAEELIEAEKDLSDVEKATVNEFKRKARRVSLFVTFQSQVEEIVDDVFFTIMQYDRQVEKLRGEQRALAKREVKSALTAALTNLISELDDVERDMEILDENTDLSGVAAFERMREMAEGRKRLLEELDESGLDPAAFVKAKIATMKPITEEEMDRLEKLEAAAGGPANVREESATGGLKAAPESASSNALRDVSKGEKSTASDAEDLEGVFKGRKQAGWLTAVDESKSSRLGTHKEERRPRAQLKSENDNEPANTGEEDGSAHRTKATQKTKLRAEMETQLGQIMGDVEHELKEEGVFDDLNEEEAAEVKTEAFRSLAKTLTNLLEKLDEAEDNIGIANQGLEEENKQASGKPHSATSKHAKAKDMEKRLNVWRKLVEGLDDEQQSESNDGVSSSERKPLGMIQVKKGDATKSKSSKGDVRVRVSTIKRKETDESSNDESEQASETAKLEDRLAKKLKDAGFDTQGRPVQVKIITNLDLGENADNLVHTLSDEESEQFTNVIYAILGEGGLEHATERRRQQSLEDSYNFGGTDSEGSGSNEEKKSAPMETVVGGGGRS